MEITTQMTYENYIKYFLYSQKKMNKIFNIIGIIFIVLAITDAISCLFEPLILEDLWIDIAFILSFMIIGIIFIAFRKKIQINTANRMYSSNKFLVSNPVTTFHFNQNNFKVLVTSSLGIEDCTYSYDMIVNLIETDEHLFITIGTNSAHLIRKTNDNKDTINQIVKFLKEEKRIPYTLDINNNTKK